MFFFLCAVSVLHPRIRQPVTPQIFLTWGTKNQHLVPLIINVNFMCMSFIRGVGK